MPAFYAIVLLIAFYALVVAEVLIPSGGFLGAIAAVVAVTSIIIGFTYNATFAGGLVVVYLVTTPVLFAVVIKLWPKTRIGRQMLNIDTLESQTVAPPPTTLDGVRLDDLVGQCGVVTADLLPHGQVKINGHKANAVSTGLAIDKGTPIWTLRAQGNELVVRAATSDELALMNAGNPTDPGSNPKDKTESKSGSDSASVRSSLEDIDFDLFNDPPS